VSDQIQNLFATTPVVTQSQPPVIVVGLPRSGSSFLSHVLSALDGWYVWDDLYFLQKVKAFANDDVLTAERVGGLLTYLGWTIRVKLNHDDDFTRPNLTMDEIDQFVHAMGETFKDGGITWSQLLEEWMTRLAHHHGCTHWGYKTPQDFHHMDELSDVFPGIKFVYIVRDPRRMMASFKFVNLKDGDPGQYHPLVYANYWKMAYKKVNRFADSHPNQVLTVRFEDLTANPDQSAVAMAEFLESELIGQVPEQGKNTSFKAGARRSITDLEKWYCQLVNKPILEELHYDKEPVRIKLGDFWDLVKTSFRFVVYQCTRLVKKKDARGSVGNFVRSLVSGK
jgi:hypothetical protein